MAAVLSPARPGFLPVVVGDGSAAGWILFLLFAAGDGGAAERILLLLEHPGEFVRLDLLCEAGWSPSVGVWMDLLFGVLLLGFVVGVVLAGVRVACWASGLAVRKDLGPIQGSRQLCSPTNDLLQLSNVWGPLFALAWR